MNKEDFKRIQIGETLNVKGYHNKVTLLEITEDDEAEVYHIAYNGYNHLKEPFTANMKYTYFTSGKMKLDIDHLDWAMELDKTFIYKGTPYKYSHALEAFKPVNNKIYIKAYFKRLVKEGKVKYE